MDVALTRGVSRAIARCELTYLERQPIDHARAVAQHAEYCRVLESLGLRVVGLDADPDLPDACFVEDAAVVLDEIAVLASMGAESRRGELDAVAHALSAYRPLSHISLPATLDGGDVLRVGRRLFVGLSPRTDAGGVAALRDLVEAHGYRVVPVRIQGCLHLKSAVTALDDESVLANPDWVDLRPFHPLEVVRVHPDEPWAANVLRLRDGVVAHAGFLRTHERLLARGLDVRPVDVSEFLKAEAGVTCKSLVFRAAPA
jgi:dimethylargininase